MHSKFGVFKVISSFMLLGLVLAACGGAPTQAPAPADTTPEGEVDIVAWPGYIERGANDPTVDWVTSFEKESGCTVKVKDAATSDEMVQLINGGGYDLVTASGDASLRLVYGGSVQEVDVNRIPSYSKVDPRLQSAAW